MTSFRNSVFSYSAGQSCTCMVWIEDTPSYSLVEAHGLDVGVGPQDQLLYPCLEPGGWHGAERGGGEGNLHTTVCSLCAAPLSWAQWLSSKSSLLVFGDAEREIESTEKILGYQPKIKLMDVWAMYYARYLGLGMRYGGGICTIVISINGMFKWCPFCCRLNFDPKSWKTMDYI